MLCLENSIFSMQYLKEYLLNIHDTGQRASIQDFTSNLMDNVNRNYNFHSNLYGVILGEFQSGKTAQMLGAIARFADDGYKIFLILTSDSVDLQRQTYRRTVDSLVGFCVLSEHDEQEFTRGDFGKPVVIVLKKNSRVLKKWRDLLCSSAHCKGKFLIIFDDEGDNASLNTLINRGGESTINRHLNAIKDSASSSVYFSVTATPQALLLQSTVSGWHPAFVNYFQPGKGYLGGDYFYSEPKPFCIRYTGEHELDEVVSGDDNFCPIGLQQSILYFLVVCAYKKMKGESNCNFMIHPSSRTNIHERFENRIEEHLNLLSNSSSEQSFENVLKEVWMELRRTKPDLDAFEDIKDTVMQMLYDMEFKVYTLNSVSMVGRNPDVPDSLRLDEGFNIVVGGNTLGRGITFPHLQIVYYCRTSRAPQADTFWQHSRIFGYDREAELVRIFMPESLYRLFCELNKSNRMLINQIRERGLNGVELVYPYGMRPTRKNVLDNKHLKVIMGGINIFPMTPIDKNTEVVDSLVSPYIGGDFTDVSSETIISILTYVGSVDATDFDSQKYINCIRALSKKRPKMKFKLLVRNNRDISKGTGTLLSPTDRQKGDAIRGDVVLILYRVNGQVEKGWNGSPLWIPNIKFPIDCCFYDVD